MRKLLFILFLASPCLAAGPKYNYSDPKMNDELQNVYKDIGNVLRGTVRISSSSISTATINNLTVSTLTVTSSATIAAMSITSSLSFSPSVVSFKIGTFSKPGSTGNQSVTGVGFTPRLVMLVGFYGDNSQVNLAIGAFTSVAQIGMAGFRALASGDVGGAVPSTSLAYYDTGESGATTSTATFVSMDSDGFTINWASVNPTVATISYIAFK